MVTTRSTAGTSGTAAKVALVCLSVMIGGALVEVAARAMLRPADTAPVQNWPRELVVPHATRDYAWAPNFAGSVELGGRYVTVRTNALGLRDEPLDPATSQRQVLALGDSFTVGFGVEAGEAWPARLEQRLAERTQAVGLRVVNGGVSGYSVAQIRATAEELLPLLRPQLLVVGIYSSRYWRIWNPYVYFHGYTAQRRLIPRLRVDDSGVLRVSSAKPRGRRLEQWLDDHSRVGSALFRALPVAWRGNEVPPPSPDSFAESARPFLAEIGRLNALARRHDSKLLILLVSHTKADGRFREIQKQYNGAVGQYCAERDIPYLDPIPGFEHAIRGGASDLQLPDDHHWSPRGHDLVAQLLARAIGGTSGSRGFGVPSPDPIGKPPTTTATSESKPRSADLRPLSADPF
jgi:lysophospholipase L1-like esterase